MSAATTSPAGYRLVLPHDWWSVDLDPVRTAGSVAALVERQWRGVDDAPHLKAQARELLHAQARDAREAGGLELYLSVGTLHGVPLSASLLVSAQPLADPSELADVVERRRRQGADVGQVDLPAGTGLRARWTQASAVPDSPELDPAQLPVTTCVDVLVPVPRAPLVLLLSFRTPMEPLAEPLVGLFDAVLTTLRWDDAPVRRNGQNGTSR